MTDTTDNERKISAFYGALMPLDLDKLIDPAREYYSVMADRRKYHNIIHALTVGSLALDLVYTTSAPNFRAMVVLAGLWHDAVYVPGAQNGANEECSAMALHHSFMFEYPVPTPEQKEIVEKAVFLIRHTDVKTHLTSDVNNVVWTQPYLASLLDADLHSLSLDYPAFCRNQRAIIEEHNGSPNAENCKKVADFLGQFLTCRQYIYYTNHARKYWEEPARANIKRWCEEHKEIVNV